MRLLLYIPAFLLKQFEKVEWSRHCCLGFAEYREGLSQSAPLAGILEDEKRLTGFENVGVGCGEAESQAR